MTNQTATKGDVKELKKELKGDIKGLKSDVKGLKGEIALVRLDMKGMEQRLDDKSRKYKDEILTKIDSFAGKTAALEQENTVGAKHTRELRVQVDNHEERIKVLESA